MATSTSGGREEPADEASGLYLAHMPMSWVTTCKPQEAPRARPPGRPGPGILATERRPSAIDIYPSVRAAVDALRAESQTEREP